MVAPSAPAQRASAREPDDGADRREEGGARRPGRHLERLLPERLADGDRPLPFGGARRLAAGGALGAAHRVARQVHPVVPLVRPGRVEVDERQVRGEHGFVARAARDEPGDSGEEEIANRGPAHEPPEPLPGAPAAVPVFGERRDVFGDRAVAIAQLFLQDPRLEGVKGGLPEARPPFREDLEGLAEPAVVPEGGRRLQDRLGAAGRSGEDLPECLLPPERDARGPATSRRSESRTATGPRRRRRRARRFLRRRRRARARTRRASVRGRSPPWLEPGRPDRPPRAPRRTARPSRTATGGPSRRGGGRSRRGSSRAIPRGASGTLRAPPSARACRGSGCAAARRPRGRRRGAGPGARRRRPHGPSRPAGRFAFSASKDERARRRDSARSRTAGLEGKRWSARRARKSEKRTYGFGCCSRATTASWSIGSREKRAGPRKLATISSPSAFRSAVLCRRAYQRASFFHHSGPSNAAIALR